MRNKFLTNFYIRFGENTHKSMPAKNLIKLYLAAINNTLMISLIFFGLVSIGLGAGFPDSEDERPYAYV